MQTAQRALSAHPMPFVRIELAVMAVMGGQFAVLLGRRSEAPYAGRWALPGGVLRIDLDATLDAGCQRVAGERLGVALPGATQLCAVGAKNRDPRAPWALSVVYRCTMQAQQLHAEPGKRLQALKWVEADAASGDSTLAFDHADLIGKSIAALRDEVDALRFPRGLLPEQFTLGELQALCEAVLRRPLDKSSFRRRIDMAGCVEPVPGAMRTGAFRPAQVFQLATSGSP